MLSARRLSVRVAGEAHTLFDDLSLAVEAGESVAVTGRSGTGKTTLLHCLSGLVPWMRPARLVGEIELDGESLGDLDPGQRAHLMATCLDRPDAQLFLHTPRQELAAAERLYPSGSSSGLRLVELLGLEGLLDRRITELSSGERQRVALAVALTASPRPVLLDEPTAHLDEDGARALADLIVRIRGEGGSVLMVEQSGWRVLQAVSRWTELGCAGLGPCPPPQPPELDGPLFEPDEEVVLRLRGVDLEKGKRQLLRQAELDLRRGEIILISGPNGSGKSTLGRVLAGLERPAAGEVSRSPRQVALMLPDPGLQLFATTVATELAGVGADNEEVARVLRRHRLGHASARAPWTLSRGERQRLVHATLDLLRPHVMVVDEPGQGLDPWAMAQLVELIVRRAEKGRSYIIFSHRHELAACAHRWLEIRDGRLLPVARGGR